MLLLKFIKNPVTVRHHLSSCQQEGGRQPGRRSCPGALPFCAIHHQTFGQEGCFRTCSEFDTSKSI